MFKEIIEFRLISCKMSIRFGTVWQGTTFENFYKLLIFCLHCKSMQNLMCLEKDESFSECSNERCACHYMVFRNHCISLSLILFSSIVPTCYVPILSNFKPNDVESKTKVPGSHTILRSSQRFPYITVYGTTNIGYRARHSVEQDNPNSGLRATLYGYL